MTDLDKKMLQVERYKNGAAALVPHILSGKCPEETVARLLEMFKHVAETGRLPEAKTTAPAPVPSKTSRPPATPPAKRPPYTTPR